MAYIQWKFEANDAVVQARLSSGERGDVTRWQQDDGYVLEFHTGHDTGYPIYVRLAGEKGGSSAPKFDTRNKSVSDYYPKRTTAVSINKLSNGGKLSKLPSRSQRDIEAIIGTSWASLALIAQRYWNSESAPAEETAEVADLITCNKCHSKFPRPQATTSTGMVPCPKCGSQQYVG